MRFARSLALVLVIGWAAPAMAQVTDTLPRFEALEQQQLAVEQNRLDDLARQQQDQRNQNLLPGSGVSSAEQALRDLDYQRETQRILLENQQQREQVARERQLADAALINKTVPSYSSTVIQDPERFILPPAPPGKYYARVDGRFVLVDAGSQLVSKVMPIQPTDPFNDLPAGPLPSTQQPLGARVGSDLPNPTRSSAGFGVVSPPKQPPLPDFVISRDSPYYIRDPAKRGLGAPPDDHYYANVGRRILLIDASTGRAVALIRSTD